MLPDWTGVFLFLLMSAILSDGVDWCRLRCNSGQLHTMCGYEESSPPRQCKNMMNTMTPAKRADLLHWHNSYRNSIAKGRIGVPGFDTPGVANMIQMTYYDDLETIAQKWAELCVPAHDVCRTTPRFEDDKGFNSGQNFGTQMSDLRIPSDGMTWYNFLQWTNERIHVPAAELKVFGQTKGNQLDTWLHWTQLVWADSYTLGCAEVVYEIGGQFERTTFCNYAPGGNLKGHKPFKMGPACSKCPRGTSCRADSGYPSLCALPDDPKVREDFITSFSPASHLESDLPSNSEELAAAVSDRWKSGHKNKDKSGKTQKPKAQKIIYENVEKHKEPGQHEPLPDTHYEPGEHEPKSSKHKEPGKHEPNKPSKHVEPGEHETVLEKHEEPGRHEPVQKMHMEPGDHEEMPLKHVEPGRHEEIDPEAGSTEHKEPGWHEPLPKKHREPGDHEPLPEKHVEPGKHEVASPKKHKEPGMHEPKNPKKHYEPGEHEPEIENHKEPGEHEPEPEEHDEPGEHEEAKQIILEGGRAGPGAAAPSNATKPATSRAAAREIPKNWQKHEGPLPAMLPLPGEKGSPDLSQMQAVGESGPLVPRSLGGGNGTKNGTDNSGGNGCEDERVNGNAMSVISIVVVGLIYTWFGEIVHVTEMPL